MHYRGKPGSTMSVSEIDGLLETRVIILSALATVSPAELMAPSDTQLCIRVPFTLISWQFVCSLSDGV